MSEPEEIAQEVDEDDRTGDSVDTRSDDMMSSFLKYLNDWKCFYSNNYYKEIHENSLHGELRTSSYRSVCWRILLNIFVYQNPEISANDPVLLSSDPDSEISKDSWSCVEQWSSHITQCRQEYDELKQSLALDPTLSRVDNPLSQNTESVWYKHFCDTELKSVIRQDVIRTFPSLDFFRNNERIQELMVAILFVYARKYPHMCYRQGMHEILAPIIFVLHCDHQALLHALEVSEVDEHLMNILNEKYLEHDAFTIFSKVMSCIENYYLINDSTPTSSGYFPPSATNSTFSCITDNHVVTQLYHINEHILKPADPELHHQLYHLKIPLTLFGIRWLRLLFGREFSLQDLLVLWDVIFAEGSHETGGEFALVNYVVVAMLVAIRDHILLSDHIDCLSYLMRYPPGMDVSSIIDHALSLKYPHLYPELDPLDTPTAPPPATSKAAAPVSSATTAAPVNSATSKAAAPVGSATSKSDVPSATSKAKKTRGERSRYRFLSLSSRHKMNPAGPDIVDALPIVEVSGHSQLVYYRDIMCKCHSTLTRCSQLIESNPRGNGGPVLSQVLRDIKQVCSMLEAAHVSPPRSLSVEMASEATPSPSPASLKPRLSESEEEELELNLPPPRSDVDMKTFSCTELLEGEVCCDGFPASYPHHENHAGEQTPP